MIKTERKSLVGLQKNTSTTLLNNNVVLFFVQLELVHSCCGGGGVIHPVSCECQTHHKSRRNFRRATGLLKFV